MAKGRWQASYQTPAPLGPRAGLALDQHGKVPVGQETPSTHSIWQTRVTCPSRAALSALGCAPALPPTATATGVHPGLQGLWCPSPCTPLHTPSCQPRFSMRVEGPEGAAVVCPLARVTPPHDFQVTGFSSVTTAFLLQTGSGSRARFSPLGSAALRLKGISPADWDPPPLLPRPAAPVCLPGRCASSLGGNASSLHCRHLVSKSIRPSRPWGTACPPRAQLVRSGLGSPPGLRRAGQRSWESLEEQTAGGAGRREDRQMDRQVGRQTDRQAEDTARKASSSWCSPSHPRWPPTLGSLGHP